MGYLKDDEAWVVWRPDFRDRKMFPLPHWSGYRREELRLRIVEEIGEPWKSLYKQGFRIRKCRLIPIDGR